MLQIGLKKFSQGSIEVRRDVEWICAVNVRSFQHMYNVQLLLDFIKDALIEGRIEGQERRQTGSSSQL